ncbi:MAG TPA: hypothetical protein VKU00_08310 [Chthonomonadaceae bacterium]|nr:hypothetical protein [Chthonomonadaceae bacterium]
MRGSRWIGWILALWVAAVAAEAQFQAKTVTLTADERQQLTQGCDRLRERLKALRVQSLNTGKPAAELLPDVEIYLDAVDRNLRENLFFSSGNVKQAQDCLKEGEARAEALKEGRAPWTQQTGVILLGYRSQVDGSVQPYQLFVPHDYDFTARKPRRLDIFLHGRGDNFNEPAFLYDHGWAKGDFGKEGPKDLALFPYGRGNNGWRYAGEQDVFEALADCERRYPVDDDRVTLRGFSMGGHGVWHIGLQHPGIWAAISPGAGFVETKRYKNITEPLPDWQNLLLHFSDPLDYALNAKNLPVLPYVGELDSFYTQHQLMYAAFKQEGAPYTDFLGIQTPHRYEPKALEALLAALIPVHRQSEAETVDFVTYTLRFAECKWVKVEGLEQHWLRAEVHARRSQEGITLQTRNIAALRLELRDWKGGSVRIDGQQLEVGSGDGDRSRGPSRAMSVSTLSLVKAGGRWSLGERLGLWKRPGMQGPIDDALFGPILAVAGTGKPWNDAAGWWTGQELQQFREGWERYCRATLPETTDAALTATQIRGNNLYLFGDPGSNAVLRRLLPKLPLRWTRDTFTLARKTFATGDHMPLLIFPNPESPAHYIVLNCGFTFSRADRDGSNAQQYPHLPDYAVIRFQRDHYTDDRTKDVELAGFFDENWRQPLSQ